MGMYTEIYINIDFKKNVSDDVIKTLEVICNRDLNKWQAEYQTKHPDRWIMLFNNGSYYTPSTYCGQISYDKISQRYSLIGKGDIKNYNNEIEQFFEWILPYVDFAPGYEKLFIGYMRYEEDVEPTLVYIDVDGSLLYV